MRRPFALLLLLSLVSLALAGCTDDAPAPQEGLGTASIPGPLPQMQKHDFASREPSAVPLLMPPQPALTFDLAANDRVQLALDAEGSGPLEVRVEGPQGPVGDAWDVQAGKNVLVWTKATPGAYRLFAQSAGAGDWTFGIVVTTFPVGFVEGTTVQVSTPEQTQIEHRFYPSTIEVPAGEDARLTLYDFDPHAGIENLQHNLHFPDLGLRTEGHTTWGEVRVLDLPALPKGNYPFQCEVHGFDGVLTAS